MFAMNRWLEQSFRERILPFDSAAARAYAEVATDRRLAGGRIGEADCQIAAICRSRVAALVTRNLRDFENTRIKVIGRLSREIKKRAGAQQVRMRGGITGPRRLLWAFRDVFLHTNPSSNYRNPQY